METNNLKLSIWQENYNSYKSSGLTKKQWCLKHDMRVHQLDYQINMIKKLKTNDESSIEDSIVPVEDENGYVNESNKIDICEEPIIITYQTGIIVNVKSNCNFDLFKQLNSIFNVQY